MAPYHSMKEYTGLGTGCGLQRSHRDCSENGPLSQFTEAYDVEMKALEAALIMIHNLIVNDNSPPSKIIISTDNTGAIQQIFQGSPGIDQMSSLTFCKHILDLLDQYKNICFTFTWCPGHFDIEEMKGQTN